MKNNIFVKTSIILIIGLLITRGLGFLIKIIYTRILGSDGISLFVLVTPTYSLLISLASLGLPIAISKIVAEEKKLGRKIIASTIPIIIILNVLLVFATIIFAPYIANNLLKNHNAINIIKTMALVLPFISLSSLIKGYFFGKQKMIPYTTSNVIEQIVRLILIIIIIPKLMDYGTETAVLGLILLNVVSELTSIIVFLIFLPKNFKIKKKDITPDLKISKEVLSISLPTVSSRLIGNVGFFLEPIIITNILLVVGYEKSYIMHEYGIINAYSISLLLLPSFFISAITTAIIPEISKYNSNYNFKMVKRRIKQAVGVCLFFGIIVTILMFFNIDYLMKLIFNTQEGITYYKVLAFAFILYYIEPVLISSLQALNKARETLKITTYGVIIKLLAITILSLFKIGLYGFIIAEIINILFVVFYNYYILKKVLNK